ncbi:hypothetical protein V6N12_036881 [Hibiscus sabdariffa]|uniref:Uncharacterized protein n=1 Tax=Hibiscus sabdariffa TaxID=183260 RepID=A0ABR2BVJ0_9ROSI
MNQICYKCNIYVNIKEYYGVKPVSKAPLVSMGDGGGNSRVDMPSLKDSDGSKFTVLDVDTRIDGKAIKHNINNDELHMMASSGQRIANSELFPKNVTVNIQGKAKACKFILGELVNVFINESSGHVETLHISSQFVNLICQFRNLLDWFFVTVVYARINASCRKHLWEPLVRLDLGRGHPWPLGDDKGDVSTETTGPAQADISAGLQISAECLAVLLAYP